MEFKYSIAILFLLASNKPLNSRIKLSVTFKKRSKSSKKIAINDSQGLFDTIDNYYKIFRLFKMTNILK